jgi:hypothetical protein
MSELSDSIKRLRELAKCTEAMTEQSIFKSVRQLNMHYEQGCNDIITLSDGVLSGNATINQLVELVADAHKIIRGSIEMQDAYTKKQEQACGYTCDVYTMPLEREFVTKADALLSGLKEVV